MIWTPGDPDPGPCLDSLAPQVDELVLIVNPGGSPSTGEAQVIANERTLGFGANINRGVAATSAPFVIASNSGHRGHARTRSPSCASFAEAHPRCGIAAPAAPVPRRPLAAVAPQLPDGPRHARPPHAAAPRAPPRAAAARPLPARRAARPSRRCPTGCSARSCSCAARCSSELGGLDEGYRLYGEDIDLAYRAAQGRLGALVRPERGRRSTTTRP